ncbi:MAG: ERCC4-like helicase-nuclease [Marinobacter sp. T13-3]|nr:MAG: ERCC4-like helicase-nuclease [Marinobacter sp. T13-3]
MLNLWRHPKTHEIRLYFARKAVQKALDATEVTFPPDQIKAWIEKYMDRPVVRVMIKSEDGRNSPHLAADIRKHLEAQSEVNEGLSWDALLDSAQKPKSSVPDSTDQADSDHESHPDDTDTLDTTQEDQRNRRRGREAKNLDVGSIKMGHPITIEVDHRETKLIAELMGAHDKVTIERVSLELADFRVTDRAGNELLIERKRCTPEGDKTDFEASIQGDSRLFDQSERLKFKVANSDHQVIPIILLEGNVHANATSMLLQQVDGAISFLSVVQRISVLQSYNANHSAYMIVKLAAHFSDGLYEVPSFHRNKPAALFEQKRYVLESLPGISTQIAECLLEHFGSVQAVANAREGELARVKGIGNKRSREIRRVLGEMREL